LTDQLSEDQKPLNTFSGVYGSVPKSDEKNYIEKVLKKVKSKSHYVEADKISTLSWYNKYRKKAKYREPLFGANGRVSIHIHEMAKSKGVDILFDGFDGDTTVSHGIGKINKLIIDNKFIEATRNIYRISEMYGMSFPSMLYSYIESFKLNNIPGYKRVKALFRKAVGREGTNQEGAWLNSEFSNQVDWSERRKKHIDHKYHFVKSEKESHYNRLMSGVMVWSNEMRDAASQLAGVEVRMPFWDRELVELSYNIPSDLKLRNGWSRWILRSAMGEKVPEKVRWRRGKANLGYGFEYVLKNIDIEYVRQAVLSPSYIDKYANMEKLENSLRRLKESKATFDELNGLHRATSMELWLQLNE
jgi:asparagine synthase (glutamine-hydrolysing)